MKKCENCIYKEKSIEIMNLFQSHMNRTMTEFIEATPQLLRMQDEIADDQIKAKKLCSDE